MEVPFQSSGGPSHQSKSPLVACADGSSSYNSCNTVAIIIDVVCNCCRVKVEDGAGGRDGGSRGGGRGGGGRGGGDCGGGGRGGDGGCGGDSGDRGDCNDGASVDNGCGVPVMVVFVKNCIKIGGKTSVYFHIFDEHLHIFKGMCDGNREAICVHPTGYTGF
ncbi:RNA-binding protein cabeza-like [Octopus sinensis]|uniref:RNA-binding protein cabeza-like n=1 Tax=Octopus sinensis TaxID=2607531 RepID=A0A7E6EUK2_9MOLL|nr:RNA-binding protein cabeza-like [Octopus sinensis]